MMHGQKNSNYSCLAFCKV